MKFEILEVLATFEWQLLSAILLPRRQCQLPQVLGAMSKVDYRHPFFCLQWRHKCCCLRRHGRMTSFPPLRRMTKVWRQPCFSDRSRIDNSNDTTVRLWEKTYYSWRVCRSYTLWVNKLNKVGFSVVQVWFGFFVRIACVWFFVRRYFQLAAVGGVTVWPPSSKM